MNIISYRKQADSCTPNAVNHSILYHASPKKDLEQLVPMSQTARDPQEGSVIFATPDKSYATTFLVRTDDSWAVGGVINNIHVMIVSDKKRFLANDNGGAIYELLPHTFTCDISKSGREKEWVSKTPVYPTKVTHYQSALETMIDHFVQVYFITKRDYNLFALTDFSNYTFLKTVTSANQQQNKNVRLL